MSGLDMPATGNRKFHTGKSADFPARPKNLVFSPRMSVFAPPLRVVGKMNNIRSRFGMALGVALALFPCIALAQTPSRGGGMVSSDAKDLCGKWKIESPYGGSSRVFEFFPDGHLIETSSYSSSQGESTNSYKKSWSVVGNKVLIIGPGQSSNNGQSITIEIPFDLSRLLIVETWESPTSTRTTKMFASREGDSSLPPASASSQRATSAQNPPPKIALSVAPSVKNGREGYYKTQRLSLDISLKNQSLRDSTGPLKVAYWIFGKNSKDTKFFCLFSQGKFDCNLGPSATTREFKQATDPYLNKFYNTPFIIDSSGAFEYEGWIVIVRDSSDRLVLIKATKPEWESQAAKLQGLNTSDAYDLRLDKVDGAHGPYRYY